MKEQEQVEKYAKDLATIYKSEKKKRMELEKAYEKIKIYAESLKSMVSEVRQSKENLEAAYIDTINHLVLASEFRDEDTGDHIARMSQYSALIAEKMDLPEEMVKNILFASPMHDIGKIGIPDKIMLKKGKLTDEEFEVMKSHTTIGAKILENSNAEILKISQQIAISHHEKWNGKGYPQGSSGGNIPLAGRIVCLADVFDALTSKRPYKDPYPIDIAIDIIKKERGEQFDPKIVDVFLENIKEILEIKGGEKSLDSTATFMWSERDS